MKPRPAPLPEQLDEQVATLHLRALNEVLTVFAQGHATFEARLVYLLLKQLVEQMTTCTSLHLV